MRTYKFWQKIQGTLIIDGRPKQASFLGGSNNSKFDAERSARKRLEAVQRRIDGKEEEIEEYRVEIKEEVITELDSKNVVTRNRYGALVLNSEQTMFIDIDQPPFSLLNLFLFWKKKGTAKERILDMIRKKAKNYPRLDFRVYETQKGVRVIVTGQDFDGASKEAQNLMRQFNSDHLYSLLCAKQECFRARLTPKPYRMKCKTRKIVFPRDTIQENIEHDAWVAQYESHSTRFATCKFLENVGSASETRLVRYHDELTKAHSSLKLA